MAKLKNKEEVKETKFDPSKSYQWSPEAEFTLSGAEFDLLYKSLRSNLQDPQFLANIQQYEALKLMEKTFADAVETGVIVEVERQETVETDGDVIETGV